jgi:quinone-modifying oxidoreductase subunit QmoC
MATLFEIIPHKKFSSCAEEKSRLLGHLLIFYGFIGAMATAGLALFATIILKDLGSPVYLESPINLPNPIKILGVASGAALLIGGLMQVSNRMKQRPGIGSGGYGDWLFLIMILSVGLTGLLAWILRLAQVPVIAYADYYLHLVLVFFLLWYAPYSKFAHMFYRTLALVWAKGSGQDKPRKNLAA